MYEEVTDMKTYAGTALFGALIPMTTTLEIKREIYNINKQVLKNSSCAINWYGTST